MKHDKGVKMKKRSVHVMKHDKGVLWVEISCEFTQVSVSLCGQRGGIFLFSQHTNGHNW